MDVKGKYLGTIVADRLLHLPEYASLSTVVYPGYAGYPGYIGPVARRGRFVPEGEREVRELQAAGVSAHTLAKLYPARLGRHADVQVARLTGQRAARVRKELGDWLGL